MLTVKGGFPRSPFPSRHFTRREGANHERPRRRHRLGGTPCRSIAPRASPRPRVEGNLARARGLPVAISRLGPPRDPRSVVPPRRLARVPGVVVQPGTYDHGELSLNYFSNQSKPFSYSMRVVAGGRFGGDRVSVASEVGYRVGEKFRTSLEFDYNDFDLPNGEFTANLARWRISYSFTPKMPIQALIQYNEQADIVGTNIRFSWLQTANSGLYLVYNEVDERMAGAPPTGREFILKYSHIFDVFN